MADYLSPLESQPCQPGAIVVNIGAGQWRTYANVSGHAGSLIGMCVNLTIPGNSIQVITSGRFPYSAYNLGAGNATTVQVGSFPSRGVGSPIIGTCGPDGEIFLNRSYVGEPASGIVDELFGMPQKSIPPTPGQILIWDGTYMSWTTAAILPGTADQILDTNHAGSAIEWFTLGGDATFASHNLTVTGLQSKALPSLPGSQQFLGYSGSAWNFSALTGDVSQGSLSGSNLPLTVTQISGSSPVSVVNGNFTSPAGTNFTIQAGTATGVPTTSVTLAASSGGTNYSVKLSGANFTPGQDVTYLCGTNALRWYSVNAAYPGFYVYFAASDGNPVAQLTGNDPNSGAKGAVIFGAGGSNAPDCDFYRVGVAHFALGNDNNGNTAAQLDLGTNSANPFIQLVSGSSSSTIQTTTPMAIDTTTGLYGITIGTTNASGVTIGRSATTTTINGTMAVSALTVTGAFTQSGGAFSATGNAASQLITSSGGLTITGAAASTWKTSAGALTISGFAGINFQNNGTTQFDLSVTSASTVTLAAGISLAGAAGAGALSLGSMTGAATMPTGNLAWTGASNSTMALAASGASGTVSITAAAAGVTLTAGAASTWSTSSGALTLTSAAAATWSTGAGALTLQGFSTLVLSSNNAVRSWTMGTDGSLALDSGAAPTFALLQTAVAANASPATGTTFRFQAQAGAANTSGSGATGGNLILFGGAGGASTGSSNNANGGDLILGTGTAGTGGSGSAGLSGFLRHRLAAADRMLEDWARTTAATLTLQGQQRVDLTTTAGNLNLNGFAGTQALVNGTLYLDCNVTNSTAITMSEPLWGTTGGMNFGVATSALATGTFTPAAGAPKITLTGGALSGNLTVALANAAGTWFIDAAGITLNGHSLIISSGTATLTFTALPVASKSGLIVSSVGGNTICCLSAGGTFT